MNTSKRIATAQATPKHTIHIDADCYGWYVIVELTGGSHNGAAEAIGRIHSSEAAARAAANREYTRLRDAERIAA